MKNCGKCKEIKQLEEFHKNPSQRLGRSNYCKKCTKEYSKKWTTPENLAKKYEARRRPDRMRKHKSNIMFKKYGITMDQFESIWESQGRCCKICKSVTNSKGKAFAVDHCHRTLKVRGILCDNCNHLLGKADDSLDILISAINYLKSNSIVG